MKQHKFWSDKFTSSGILAIAFILYILFVGSVMLPESMNIFRDIVTGKIELQTGIDDLKTTYEGMLSTNPQTPFLQNKGTYINFNGFMSKFLGQSQMNGCIKLRNGHLALYDFDGFSSEMIESFEKEIISMMNDICTNIIHLKNAQTERNKYFLFVIPPSQISSFENLLPTGYADPYNTIVDSLITLLAENNIHYLDLREELFKSGISNSEAFFISDHHWTPQTAFWAYGKILEELEHIGVLNSLDHKYFSPENFDFQKHEQSFLGSCGKRTGIFYAGIDDFYTIKPKFNTEISIEIPSEHIFKKGSFEDIYLSSSVISTYDFFNENAYGLWGWGDQPFTSWRNSHAPEDKKFLLIGDSFGNIPFSLMSLYFSSCDELDMRSFRGNFTEYYEKYEPDVVVLMSTTGENIAYPFFS